MSVRHLGAAAAGTLGYIFGNTRGAYHGARLGYKAAGWSMPSTKRKSKKQGKLPYKTVKTEDGRRMRVQSTARGSKSGSSRRSSKQSTTGSTKRRSTRSRGAQNLDAGSSQFSRRYSSSKKSVKGFKRACAPQFLTGVTYGSIVMNPPSGQAAITLDQGVPYQFPDQIYLGVTSLGSTNYVLGTNDFNEMQRILQATEPATVSGQIPALLYRTRKMMLMTCSVEVEFKNQSVVPAMLQLYDLQLRRDISAADNQNSPNGAVPNPVTIWNNGLVDEITSPQVYVTSGAGTQQTATTYTSTSGAALTTNQYLSQEPGSTPFQSMNFTQFYKVKRVSKVQVQPGCTHKHYMKFSFSNGTFSNERLLSWIAYKGITTQLMAVATGGIVDSGSGQSPVAYSVPKFSYTAKTKYKFTAVEKDRSCYTQYDVLTQFSAGKTVDPMLDQIVSLTAATEQA